MGVGASPLIKAVRFKVQPSVILPVMNDPQLSIWHSCTTFCKSSAISTGFLILAGCTAAMNPPAIPAIQVAPEVAHLWPKDASPLPDKNDALNNSLSQSFASNSSLGIDNGIIAVINQKAVTLKEFDNAFFRAVQDPSWRSNEKELYHLILDQLVERQLFLIHASTLKEEQAIVISDHQVEQELERIVSNVKGGWEAYRRMLEQDKMSIEDITQQIKENLTISRVQNELYRGLGMPSPKEIREEYEKNLEAFSSAEKRSVSLITAYMGDYKNKPKKGEKLTKEITQELASGKDFSKVAQRYSDGAKASEGGLQGWIGQEELAKDINDVAFKMDKGEQSGPHKMGELVFFVRCNDIQPAQTKSLTEVREQVQQRLYQQQRQRTREQKMKQLMSTSHIEKLDFESYIQYRKSQMPAQKR
jgi:parvulin-like peptidyl-prolyl isomerase